MEKVISKEELLMHANWATAQFADEVIPYLNHDAFYASPQRHCITASVLK